MSPVRTRPNDGGSGVAAGATGVRRALSSKLPGTTIVEAFWSKPKLTLPGALITTVPWAPRLTVTETAPSDRHPNAEPTKLQVVPVTRGHNCHAERHRVTYRNSPEGECARKCAREGSRGDSSVVHYARSAKSKDRDTGRRNVRRQSHTPGRGTKTATTTIDGNRA
jgi:hypothetical protein